MLKSLWERWRVYRVRRNRKLHRLAIALYQHQEQLPPGLPRDPDPGRTPDAHPAHQAGMAASTARSLGNSL